jgi:hypothetical protein
MYGKTLKVLFVISLSLLSACASNAPEPTSTEEHIVLIATKPVPTITAKPGSPGFYPLSTRTGIADIDAVLAAVESGDPQQLRDLVHITTVVCTKAEGLGGPPKCMQNEAEGTLVKGLPILGPEGQFLREWEISKFPGVYVIGLYAVYGVSDSAYSEEAYPAGEYAAMFKAAENQPNVVIQIRGGIVRIDYLYPPISLDETIQRDASELVLAPK